MGDDIESIEVECTTLGDIVAEHGVPYYLKIDIEEADLDAVESLGCLKTLPRYVSAEAHSTRIVEALHDRGYRRFTSSTSGPGIGKRAVMSGRALRKPSRDRSARKLPAVG